MSSDAASQRWVVHGRVQGVGFRYFTFTEASRLGLRGRVRNLPDGSVEIRVAGKGAELERLMAAVRRGPRHSQVDRVESTELEGAADWSDFEIDRF